ncbi:hypothetical protein CVT24_012231 [Panaeolus cyanescens]|uniref:Thiamine-binding protein domain-containing protein n=1 Tax=Panaeolus cyanescens TaxID=181874 RepID=A0A409VYV9_9AGAR|nr:hypothetical protein CVT24_012231 [Panaeolus cyanescens]
MQDLYAVADFCLIPIGTGNTSVAEEVAECQRILAQSGLKYKATSVSIVLGYATLYTHVAIAVMAQTSVIIVHPFIPLTLTNKRSEGPWSQVSKAIHDCHAAVHAKGAQRIATDIRIGTRIDREIPFGQGNDAKVTRVEDILAKDGP